jgi:hypothetical protein
VIRQDFYDQLEISEVGQQYLNLVSLCKNRALIPEEGYEIHHIFPTSLGGLNVNDNKVKFTIFEHCKAHALLAQAIPCYKTLKPLTKMSYGQVKSLQDVERVELDEIFKWSELREKALHHPKSPEHIEKYRQTMAIRHIKRTPEHVAKMSRKGMIAVNNGEIAHLIYPEQLDEYLAKGWTKGRTPKTKERLSQSHLGLPGTSLGKKAIYLGNKELKVNPEDLQTYLDQGWVLGRPAGKINAGRIRLTKDGKRKFVYPEDLDKYLNEGWIKVRKD